MRLDLRDRRRETIAEALLGMERLSHDAGWGSPPRLFTLEGDTASPEVECHALDTLTGTLRDLLQRSGTSMGSAMLVLAEASETLRAAGMPPNQNRRTMPEGVEPCEPDSDLFAPPREGWRVYGVGLLTESWKVEDQFRRGVGFWAAQRGALDQHPARLETRQVFLVGRDGLVWQVDRIRDHEPEITVTDPRSPERPVGRVMNALSRVCNSIAGERVPIIPFAPGDDLEATNTTNGGEV